MTSLALAASVSTATGPSGAEVAAWFALAVAALALAWNVYNAIQHRPHYHALLSKAVLITVGQPNEWTYRVTVLNTGSEPGTVANVGLEDRREGKVIITGIGEQLNGRKFKGPVLPARIEPNDILEWSFGDETTRDLDPTTPVGGVIYYYRPIRWWQRRNTFPMHQRRTRGARPREG